MAKIVIEAGDLTEEGLEALQILLDYFFGIDHNINIDKDEIVFKAN